MSARRITSLATWAEVGALRRQWIQSGRCARCFHQALRLRAEVDGEDHIGGQRQPLNAPNRGPTRQERAAMASEEVKMLAQASSQVGSPDQHADSAEFFVGPQALRDSLEAGNMDVSTTLELERPLATKPRERESSRNDDIDGMRQARGVRTPSDTVEKTTSGGSKAGKERNTHLRVHPPPSITAPGEPFSHDRVSKRFYLRHRSKASTIATANFEGVLNAHVTAIVNPDQDSAHRDPNVLARKLLSGKVVRFEHQGERDAACEAAMDMTGAKEYWKARRPASASLPNESGDVPRVPVFWSPHFEPIPSSIRESIVNRVARGVYDVDGILDGKPKYKQSVLNDVAKMTMHNGTYLSADGERFLKKVQSLLPATLSPAMLQQREKLKLAQAARK